VNGNDCYAASSWKKIATLFAAKPSGSEAAHFRGEHVHNNKRIENNAAAAAAAPTHMESLRGIMKWGDGQKRLAIYLCDLCFSAYHRESNELFWRTYERVDKFRRERAKTGHTIVYSFCVELDEREMPSAVFGRIAFILMRAAW
jgi:hypothetical protein